MFIDYQVKRALYLFISDHMQANEIDIGIIQYDFAI